MQFKSTLSFQFTKQCTKFSQVAISVHALMALSCARSPTAEAQFVARLTASAAAGDLLSGAALHARFAKAHVSPTTFLANHLLLFYSRLALLALTRRRLLDEISQPNVFSHNALLAAHARDPRLSSELFARIPIRMLCPTTRSSPPSRRPVLPRTRSGYYRACGAGALPLTASLYHLPSRLWPATLLQWRSCMVMSSSGTH
jgi:hypothetical protein